MESFENTTFTPSKAERTRRSISSYVSAKYLSSTIHSASKSKVKPISFTPKN
jgi:hypothetical protein